MKITGLGVQILHQLAPSAEQRQRPHHLRGAETALLRDPFDRLVSSGLPDETRYRVCVGSLFTLALAARVALARGDDPTSEPAIREQSEPRRHQDAAAGDHGKYVERSGRDAKKRRAAADQGCARPRNRARGDAKAIQSGNGIGLAHRFAATADGAVDCAPDANRRVVYLDVPYLQPAHFASRARGSQTSRCWDRRATSQAPDESGAACKSTGRRPGPVKALRV